MRTDQLEVDPQVLDGASIIPAERRTDGLEWLMERVSDLPRCLIAHVGM
jgi:hypothetical protein